MKTRWQESVEAAVAACDTPLPWARGATRKAMIQRREVEASTNDPSHVKARQA